MKAEALLFAAMAAFFAVVTTGYAAFHPEPAGTTALLVSFVMSALISLFLWTRYVRHGRRPQDRGNAPVREGAGPLAFFSPRSYYPAVAAAGTALAGLGVVYGLWLFLIGVGVLAPGILGFVFQHNDR
ncbi:MAG: aa3-type cytochrome oxidase subunit IV [Streptomyces sp.]|uniref:aa3-type cytochrome oxidase subunit IV n=1 Tax=Streptomyces sp. TaxID=1931 RepID=UPI003D6A453F